MSRSLTLTLTLKPNPNANRWLTLTLTLNPNPNPNLFLKCWVLAGRNSSRQLHYLGNGAPLWLLREYFTVTIPSFSWTASSLQGGRSWHQSTVTGAFAQRLQRISHRNISINVKRLHLEAEAEGTRLLLGRREAVASARDEHPEWSMASQKCSRRGISSRF